MSDSNHNQHRLHSHGVGDHHHDVEYYEYLLPGIYDYPVTHSAASTITAYNLPPILALSMPAWSIPDENPATYVAGPYGLVNYVSDMQSHLALPTDHTIVSGMIYQAMEPNPLTPYPHQMLVEIAEENNQMDNYGYQGYGDPRMNLCFNHIDSVSEEDGDRASELDTARGPPRMLPMEQEAMMPEEVGEPADAVPEVEMPCEVRRSSKRGHQDQEQRRRRQQNPKRKRMYEADQGYLVEEPSSEASQHEDDEDRERMPQSTRT